MTKSDIFRIFPFDNASYTFNDIIDVLSAICYSAGNDVDVNFSSARVSNTARAMRKATVSKGYGNRIQTPIIFDAISGGMFLYLAHVGIPNIPSSVNLLGDFLIKKLRILRSVINNPLSQNTSKDISSWVKDYDNYISSVLTAFKLKREDYLIEFVKKCQSLSSGVFRIHENSGKLTNTTNGAALVHAGFGYKEESSPSLFAKTSKDDQLFPIYNSARFLSALVNLKTSSVSTVARNLDDKIQQ